MANDKTKSGPDFNFTKEQNEVVSVRLPRSLVDEVRLIAEESGFTMNAAMNELLAKAVAYYREQHPRKK